MKALLIMEYLVSRNWMPDFLRLFNERHAITLKEYVERKVTYGTECDIISCAIPWDSDAWRERDIEYRAWLLALN